jgi:hypothetical protein
LCRPAQLHRIALAVLGQIPFPPTGFDASFAEGSEKPLTIGVVAKNGFAMVTAVLELVYRARILNA